MSPSKALRIALVIAPFLAATQARAADAALIEAAKKEGRVTWYTTLLINQLGGPLAEAFEKKYGIKVDATRNDPGETAMRLLQEGRADNMQADLYDGSFAPTVLLRDAGGFWTANRLTITTPGYNTNLIKEADAPKSFQDLLDPRWKGKMAWGINPGVTGATGFIGAVLAEMGEEKALPYLRALVKQDITGLKISARAVLDQVIAGEYPMALGILNDNVVISQNVGAPVAWIPMNPGLATLSVVSVTAKAKHPNAARLLAEFVLSEEGQTIARDRFYIPVNPNVAPKDPAMRPDGVKFRAVTFSPEEVDAGQPKWKKIFDDIFR